ncbi:nucleotidyltransferase family protein [Streptomyces sp. NBC_00285]|uniref:nucleotidyltransferase family protein n=1 Tax=Streptomyces sp. NBC_00285 TaxID=2975700 RepID=UPI002E282413|nr:nucleotidyltransferase family protein [Streptomyces sp. NBC_00285]
MTDTTTGIAVTTDTVLALLKAKPRSARDTVLRTARDSQHKLAGTLLSLWAAAGEELTVDQAAELRLAQERIEHYRRLWEQLQEHAPDAFLLKGMTIAALYPPGVLRSAGDLDVICPRHDDLWACARHLAATGWELEAFTVGPAHPGDTVSPHLGAEFRKPAPDPSQDPYAVGLFTAEIVTDVHGPPRQLARPPGSPLAASTVALVAERWERRFRSRDLLDLVLLLGALDEPGLRQLRADLDKAGLWPEWREAMRGIGRLGWRPAVVLPHTRAAAVRVRLLRSVRTALRWSNPVRAAAFVAQSGIEGRGGRLAALASDVIHRRPGARRLLTAGVPLFGVPVPEVPVPEVPMPEVPMPGVPMPGKQPAARADTASIAADGVRADGPTDGSPDAEPVEGLQLHDVGRHLVARTPLGAFLLVSGAARQEWLDEAAGPQSVPSTPSGPSSTRSSSSSSVRTGA